MFAAPALQGPWASAWRGLASPWTSVALALWAATVVAVRSLDVADTTPLVSSPALQLPLVLLPFALAAGALRGERMPWAAWVFCAGIAIAGWGAVQAGSAAGAVRLGEQAGSVETYQRHSPNGQISVHLGGALSARAVPGGLDVRIGTGDFEVGRAVVPPGGREVVVGPWALYRQADGAPGAPTTAALVLSPRAGGADAASISVNIAEGSSRALPDGAVVEVRRLAADFGRALGPAAQVTVRWGKDESTTAWHFVEAPDLDARLGQSPWKVRLAAVEASPAVTLGVRRRGPMAPLFAGLGLMAIGLLMGLVGRRA